MHFLGSPVIGSRLAHIRQMQLRTTSILKNRRHFPVGPSMLGFPCFHRSLQRQRRGPSSTCAVAPATSRGSLTASVRPAGCSNERRSYPGANPDPSALALPSGPLLCPCRILLRASLRVSLRDRRLHPFVLVAGLARAPASLTEGQSPAAHNVFHIAAHTWPCATVMDAASRLRLRSKHTPLASRRFSATIHIQSLFSCAHTVRDCHTSTHAHLFIMVAESWAYAVWSTASRWLRFWSESLPEAGGVLPCCGRDVLATVCDLAHPLGQEEPLLCLVAPGVVHVRFVPTRAR